MSCDEKSLTITIIGAGGVAGSKVTEKLLKGNYNVFLCEKGEGIRKLRERGLTATSIEEAVPKSDIVIMTVPDNKVGEVSEKVVPLMKSNATLILLDPAAAYIGEVAMRDDCTFVIAHPCHPQLFREQESLEARRDFFGGVAEQDIVIALLRGEEEKFEVAEKLCREIFTPVSKCHRVTVEQMAILEPIASEVAAGAAAYLMKEAFDEAVRLGVPEETAQAFMLGHIRILLAILFGMSSHKVSEAARSAINYGCNRIFKPDWKQIFESEEMKRIISEILHPRGVKRPQVRS